MYRSRLARATVFGVALWMIGGSAQAAPLFDFGSASGPFTPTRDTLGYAFTVSAPVTVDGIGLFDFGGDGLASAHTVSLWDESDPSTFLVSQVLNNGTPTAGSDPSVSTDPLGSYIYEDIKINGGITEVVLSVGNTYVLGASFNGGNQDMVATGASGIFSNSTAAFVEGRLGPSSGSNPVYPSAPRGDGRYFGPALRIAVTTVPEPVTLTLMIAGMVGMGLVLRNTSTGQPRTRGRTGALPA